MAQAQEFEKALSSSDTTVASFDEHGTSVIKRIQHFLHGSPAAVPLIVLLLSIVVFGLTIGGKFFSSYTLTLVLQQIAVVGILGAAQTLVILTAGIDLSVGVIMVMSAVVMGNCALHYGLPAPVAVGVGFLVGAICGALDGFLVADVKLLPFIVTLAPGTSSWRRTSSIPPMRRDATPISRRRLSSSWDYSVRASGWAAQC